MDVIIIGAGAAGLMAAKELSAAGLEVCTLEARDRIGGRIYSLNDLPFAEQVQGGAEFIHGKLPVTLNLLKEAGLHTVELNGEIWQVAKGKWNQESDFYKNVNIVVAKLKSLEADTTMADFMEKNFSEAGHNGLRKSLTEYIEGYYSGKIDKISAKCFLEEWMSEDKEQYRPEAGYGKMINYLAETTTKAGVLIQLSTVVKEIRWSKGQVEVVDESGQSYLAHKVLITVPTGVLTAGESCRGFIKFFPALVEKIDAAKQLGFGSVIKVLVNFDEALTDDESLKKHPEVNFQKLHMILSGEEIPTWWTQHPQHSSLLSGWLSGPGAEQLTGSDDEVILDKALRSLSSIFGLPLEKVKEKVTWWKVLNWARDEFTRGSYSYSTLHTETARKKLEEPVDNTIFFAGEGLYDGPEMGTVEAALTSGAEVAKKIIASR
jgi:monoamine oxidase